MTVVIALAGSSGDFNLGDAMSSVSWPGHSDRRNRGK